MLIRKEFIIANSTNFATVAFYALRTSFVILVILLATLTKGDNIPPILSPFFDNICNEVRCGKGTCQEDVGKPFNFVCDCDPGWKRLLQGDETNLQFLPCIIPNCSLDYSCMPAPPPFPSVTYNLSVFDPCYWTYCGEGKCSLNSTYTHTCQCNPGQSNILDVPTFPCYSQCALGSNCANLGIKVTRPTLTSDSSTPSTNANPATSLYPGKLEWMGFLLIYLVTLLWKLDI